MPLGISINAPSAKKAVLSATKASVLAFVIPLASFAVDGLIVVYYAASRTNVPGLIYNAALHQDDD